MTTGTSLRSTLRGLLTVTVIVRLARSALLSNDKPIKKSVLFILLVVLFHANFTQINEKEGVGALFFIFFRLKFGFKNIF